MSKHLVSTRRRSVMAVAAAAVAPLLATTVLVTVGTVGTTGSAQAAPPTSHKPGGGPTTPPGVPPIAHTVIGWTATPEIALVKSKIKISGYVTPATTGQPLVLEYSDSGNWRVITSTADSKSGAYSFTYPTSAVPGKASLRVIRAGSFRVLAGTSSTIHLSWFSKKFSVLAHAVHPYLPAGGKLVVVGKVSPAVSGNVQLQQQHPDEQWYAVTWAPLTKGVFSVSTTVAQAAATYRIFKPTQGQVGGNYSKPIHVTAASPEVTTQLLPHGTVGVAYSTTVAASGGTAPYTFTETGLPSGLASVSADSFGGVPQKAGLYAVTTTVSDAHGATDFITLPLVIDPVAVLSWGRNATGALGNGDPSNTSTTVPGPTLLPGGTISVAVGDGFALALTVDGAVYAWGSNPSGQLGQGGITPSSTPLIVPGIGTVIAIAAGTSTAYAVEQDGTLFDWGAGPLGDLPANPSRVRYQVTGIDHVKSVAAGDGFVVALKDDGTVWTWGEGGAGQLGNGTTTALQDTPVQVTGITDATAVAAGLTDGYAVVGPTHTVVAWGSNLYDQLGAVAPFGRGYDASPLAVTGLSGVTQLSCHDDYKCVALTSTGGVWTWGAATNTVDSVGGHYVPHLTAVPLQLTSLTGITAVSVSSGAAIALKNDGTVWGWGDSANGQLGFGASPPKLALPPVQIPGISNAIGISLGQGVGFAVTTS